MWDRLYIETNIATMTEGSGTPYGAVSDGALAIADGRITWVGPRGDLPDMPERLAGKVISLDGAWITPGLIDCHTHLVFGGERATEFEQRLEGASYEEIARAGGGILSTVTATRAADEATLVDSALGRLDSLLGEGITTVEIKSGYGLEQASECRMLRAAGALADLRPVRLRRSFLGAHALPVESKDDRTGYIERVCTEMIPAVARDGLAEAVDAFCERIGFTTEEVERVFQAAKAHGLSIKLHAEQLSDQGGTALAARYGALSADHLEYVGEDGIQAMADAGTVAVLLPGAFYFLGETQLPPVQALRDAGVAIAVATDCNPGTSPALSPLLMMNMACTFFRLTPEEALAGMTRNAARALDLEEETGSLEPGKAADLAIWRIGHPAELAYWIGGNPLIGRVFAGEADDPVACSPA